MKIDGAKILGGLSVKDFGYSKYAIDTFTPTSDFFSTHSNYPINHSLGVVPKIAFLFPSDNISWSSGVQLLFAVLKDTGEIHMSSNDGTAGRYQNGSGGASAPTSTIVNYYTTSGGALKAGTTYTLITMA